MSMVRVRRGSIAWSSSSVMITWLPSSNSNECSISSKDTSTSSFEHQRCTSIGAPSFSCSWRKCRSRSRAAVTITTGTLTRPKLKEPLHSERAMSSAPRLRSRLLLPVPQARLERGHQVIRRLGLLVLGQLDLLAGGLSLDQLGHPVAVAVLERRRPEALLQ